MEKLLTYIIKNITGSEEFTVVQHEDGERVSLEVSASSEIIGMIIGTGGATIKSIRNLLRVRAALEKKFIYISVNSSSDSE